MSAFGTKRTYALQQKLIAQDHCGASAKALISAPTVMIVMSIKKAGFRPKRRARGEDA